MRFSGARPTTLVTLLLTTVLVAATAALVVTASRSPSGPTPAAAPAAVIAPEAEDDLTVVRAVSSLAVLRDWDAARARAWSRAAPQQLGRLYLPGSAAGERDVAMLQRWRQRGMRVRGMRMQVLSVTLRHRSARRLVLEVTDRLVGAVAVAPGGRRIALPQDRASARRLVFQLRSGRWVVAAVYDLPGEGSAPASPASSTAPTSGSANS